MPKMNDYSILRKANDHRWTVQAKRTAVKMAAEVGKKMTEVKLKGSLKLAEAEEKRLSELKNTVKALNRIKVNVNRQSELVIGLPETNHNTAQYKMFESMKVDEIEKKLLKNLNQKQEKLMDIKNRVKEKTLRINQLRNSVLLERRKYNDHVKGLQKVHRTQVMPTNGSGDWSASVDKKIDALRLINHEMSSICDLAIDNLNMMDSLNEQLKNDVQEQAAIVIKILTYGTCAQIDVSEFNQSYIKAKKTDLEIAEKINSKKKRINKKTAMLELNRNLLIDEQERLLSTENEGKFQLTYSYLDGNETKVNTSDTELVTQLIENGEIDREMNPPDSITNKSESNSQSHSQSQSLLNDSVTINSDGLPFTYPDHKVNVYRLDGEKLSREIAAAEYVCEALGFENTTDVLEYIKKIKNMEIRLKNMIIQRQLCTTLAAERYECMTKLEIERLMCEPESHKTLDKNFEYLNQAGLDVQKSQVLEIQTKINDYESLFNELFFLLDHLGAKLDRCQLPVVRQYRLKKSKHMRDSCSEAMQDIHDLLNTLDIQRMARQGNDSLILQCSSDQKVSNMHKKKQRIEGENDKNRSVVTACWDTLDILKTKLEACMSMMRDAEPTEREQLEARAWFEFNTQKYIGQEMLKKGVRAPIQLKQSSSMDAINDTGIMTRDQIKQQANDIYAYFSAPKDTDDMKRSRKPTSFRKAFVIV
ncbi:uncharacterized protein LOC126898089 [Daktulosphaira vitifoliae]|uniref:uncharacterized protein LOC126898089 n=1 Tax=Daktulosphaira vitifoliae TaxID=58002 RepID=UPI0021AA0E80|nr:uncharacterized protein LOC126898089 [Daktulosphaira vitifoliae]